VFHDAPIDGIIWKPLRTYGDDRGWLCEFFRHDELPAEFHPVMAYVPMTLPGIARGRHEHADQADCFCFIRPSNFKLYLWDNRPASPTRHARQTAIVGVEKPMLVVIPAGVGMPIKTSVTSLASSTTAPTGSTRDRAARSRWTKSGTKRMRTARIDLNEQLPCRDPPQRLLVVARFFGPGSMNRATTSSCYGQGSHAPQLSRYFCKAGTSPVLPASHSRARSTSSSSCLPEIAPAITRVRRKTK